MDQARMLELRQGCRKFLTGHRPRQPREWLLALAESPYAELRSDLYNEGPAMSILEKEVADLLGKEAAIFFPKGVTAQLAAMKVWATRSGLSTVALHPKSHIAVDESGAYERLLQLVGLQVGKDHAPFTLADLEALKEPLGAVVVELPLRRAGFKLPAWEELGKIAEWTRQKKIPFHIDGARLWESTYYYGHSLAEIAALADSVYVSFYKGLGGMGGCVLAGPADFIEEAKPWRTRLAGNMFTAFPLVISALEGLHYHLPRMFQYCQKAVEVATALATIPGVVVTPQPPHTNSFQVYLPASVSALQEATARLAQQEQVWLFGYFQESALPGLTMVEMICGESTGDWTEAEIVAAVTRLLDYANSANTSSGDKG